MKNLNLVTAIAFHDLGQPIQLLYVDSVGKVLDCQPNDGEKVVGSYVLDHESLRNGNRAELLIDGEIVRLFFPVRNTWLLNEAESKEVYGYFEQWFKRINELKNRE